MEQYIYQYIILYVGAKRIEKYFWKYASPELKKEMNKKLNDLPEVNKLSESTKNSLDIREEINPVILWIVKVIMKNFGIKVAIQEP